MDHVVHRLANGLTLLIEPMADVRSAAFSLMTPAGAVFDSPGGEGAAALLTDWLLRGCGDLDSQQVVVALDEIGLQRSEVVTGYHLGFSGSTISANLPAALRIYGDTVCSPHLPEDEFEFSRTGALQTLMAIDDEPRQRVFLELRQRCYPNPWGKPSEGTVAGVEALTPDAVRAHFTRHVSPRNSILGIAGYVDPAEIIDVVNEAFGDWQPQPEVPISKGECGVRLDHVPHESTQTQIGIAYRSVPYNHPDYFAAWAAVGILSGGMSSRLFTEVREKRGLCYSVYATHTTLRDDARVLCYAGTTAERAQETLDVTLQELLKLKNGIAADELQRCQAGAKSSLIMQQESSAARAGAITRDWYHLGRISTLEEIRHQVDSLTAERLLQHLADFPMRDFTVLTLGPAALKVPNELP